MFTLFEILGFTGVIFILVIFHKYGEYSSVFDLDVGLQMPRECILFQLFFEDELINWIED